MNKYTCYITLILALALTACSSDDGDVAAVTDNDYITIETNLCGNLEVTRGTKIDAISGVGSLYLTGWHYSNFSNTSPSSFFFNQLISVDNNGAASTNYSWPGGSNSLGFFAYGPQSVTSNGLSLSTNASTNGALKFNYTVPAYSNQKDLVAGTTMGVAANKKGSISMVLRHTLTAVQFQCGSGSKQVAWTSIQITGVYGTGTYTMGTSTSTSSVMPGSWSGQKTTATYTATATTTTGTNGVALCGTSASPFILLPQTLPTGAKIRATFTDSGESVTREVSIAGRTWSPGTIATYSLSVTSRNELVLTANSVTAWGSSSQDLIM